MSGGVRRRAPVAMWVPNLRSSRAAALAVPLGLSYHQAIREKVVALLERAGMKAARAAVQMYLEQDEHAILSEDFPDGWADQILVTGAVGMLVMSGDPEAVEPATDPELIEEVMEELKELDLATFLSVTPGGTDHWVSWDDDPGPTRQPATDLGGLTLEDIDRILADESGTSSESATPIDPNGLTPTERRLGIDLSAEIAEIRRILAEHEENTKK